MLKNIDPHPSVLMKFFETVSEENPQQFLNIADVCEKYINEHPNCKTDKKTIQNTFTHALFDNRFNFKRRANAIFRLQIKVPEKYQAQFTKNSSGQLTVDGRLIGYNESSWFLGEPGLEEVLNHLKRLAESSSNTKSFEEIAQSLLECRRMEEKTLINKEYVEQRIRMVQQKISQTPYIVDDLTRVRILKMTDTPIPTQFEEMLEQRETVYLQGEQRLLKYVSKDQEVNLSKSYALVTLNSTKDTIKVYLIHEELTILYTALVKRLEDDDEFLIIEDACRKVHNSNLPYLSVDQLVNMATKHLSSNAFTLGPSSTMWFNTKLKLLYRYQIRISKTIKKLLGRCIYQVDADDRLEFISSFGFMCGKRNKAKSDSLSQVQSALLKIIRDLSTKTIWRLTALEIADEYQRRNNLDRTWDVKLMAEIVKVKELIESDDRLDLFSKLHILFVLQLPVTEHFKQQTFCLIRTNLNLRINMYISDNALVTFNGTKVVKIQSGKKQNKIVKLPQPVFNCDQESVLGMLKDLIKNPSAKWTDAHLYNEFRKKHQNVSFPTFTNALNHVKTNMEKCLHLGLGTVIMLINFTEAPISTEFKQKYKVVIQDNAIVSWSATVQLTLERPDKCTMLFEGAKKAKRFNFISTLGSTQTELNCGPLLLKTTDNKGKVYLKPIIKAHLNSTSSAQNIQPIVVNNKSHPSQLIIFNLTEVIQNLAIGRLKTLEDEVILESIHTAGLEEKTMQFSDKWWLEEIEKNKRVIEDDLQTDAFTKIHTLYVTQTPVSRHFKEMAKYQIELDSNRKITNYSAKNVKLMVDKEWGLKVEQIEVDELLDRNNYDELTDRTTLTENQRAMLIVLKFLATSCFVVLDDDYIIQKCREEFKSEEEDNELLKTLSDIKKMVPCSPEIDNFTKMAMLFATQTPIIVEFKPIASQYNAVLDHNGKISAFSAIVDLHMSRDGVFKVVDVRLRQDDLSKKLPVCSADEHGFESGDGYEGEDSNAPSEHEFNNVESVEYNDYDEPNHSPQDLEDNSEMGGSSSSTLDDQFDANIPTNGEEGIGELVRGNKTPSCSATSEQETFIETPPYHDGSMVVIVDSTAAGNLKDLQTESGDAPSLIHSEAKSMKDFVNEISNDVQMNYCAEPARASPPFQKSIEQDAKASSNQDNNLDTIQTKESEEIQRISGNVDVSKTSLAPEKVEQDSIVVAYNDHDFLGNTWAEENTINSLLKNNIVNPLDTADKLGPTMLSEGPEEIIEDFENATSSVSYLSKLDASDPHVSSSDGFEDANEDKPEKQSVGTNHTDDLETEEANENPTTNFNDHSGSSQIGEPIPATDDNALKSIQSGPPVIEDLKNLEIDQTTRKRHLDSSNTQNFGTKRSKQEELTDHQNVEEQGPSQLTPRPSSSTSRNAETIEESVATPEPPTTVSSKVLLQWLLEIIKGFDKTFFPELLQDVETKLKKVSETETIEMDDFADLLNFAFNTINKKSDFGVLHSIGLTRINQHLLNMVIRLNSPSLEELEEKLRKFMNENEFSGYKVSISKTEKMLRHLLIG